MKQVKVVNDNPVKQIVYWFALILFVGMILLSFAQVAGGNESKQSSSNGGGTSNSNQVKSKKLQIGIKKRPETCEKKSKKGDILHIHYRGTLEDGTEFDNSYKRGTPLTFSLGMGQVIQGWDQGLLGMCAGEKRKLVIPSDLGYGSAGAPPTIPPDATLIFEVECMKIEDRRVDL